MDVLTPEQRRKNMQHIRSNDTSIEIILRKKLWAEGIHFRKNFKGLPGKPDIALTKHRIAVFCDSEFFHGKDWEAKRARLSKSPRGEYWIEKIEKNIMRDHEINQELDLLGWTVIRFWGNEIKKDPDACVQFIKECILEKIINEYGG